MKKLIVMFSNKILGIFKRQKRQEWKTASVITKGPDGQPFIY